MAEHFVRSPGWEWYILAYFFLGGLSGGSYALATMLRVWGHARDEAAARFGFLVAFLALIPCPILLALDLGQPLLFWHMLVNTTPERVGPIFKPWSPMSVGSWALVVYGVFSFVSVLEVLCREGRIRGRVATAATRLLAGSVGRAVNVAGAIVGLFVASYTGVLLSVSSQPVWSDTWALGGLFLASGLSGSAALLSIAGRYRRDAAFSSSRLRLMDGYFALLELVLIVVFFVTSAPTGALARILAPTWLPLWLLVAMGIVAGVGVLGARRAEQPVPVEGTRSVRSPQVAVALVLIGVLALRAVVIYSVQL